MPVPFSDDEVVAAFPEYVVSTPRLGEGTFKAAYHATKDESEIALKVLIEPLPVNPEDFNDESLPERQGREILGMSAIDSPYVVRILSQPDLRQIGNATYVFYEEPFYSGGTLRDRLDNGPLDAGDVTELVRCLLEAVRSMWHDHRIVHRDIKPGNIVFDSAGSPVLLDLGIALHTSLSELTDSGAVSPMTSVYAAPEQFEIRRSAQIDFRTDLFAIGIVGYEALVGAHPFFTPNIALAAYLDRIENFTGGSIASTSASPELVAVIMRCLAPRLNRRYRTIDDALAAIGSAP